MPSSSLTLLSVDLKYLDCMSFVEVPVDSSRPFMGGGKIEVHSGAVVPVTGTCCS